ncbi:unnamed protein product [Amoebophrya sp. A120]|nr:unnamed protein product [Amoebophrya sp. A120]|eukprot:GSA120T00024181001.1
MQNFSTLYNQSQLTKNALQIYRMTNSCESSVVSLYLRYYLYMHKGGRFFHISFPILARKIDTIKQRESCKGKRRLRYMNYALGPSRKRTGLRIRRTLLGSAFCWV